MGQYLFDTIDTKEIKFKSIEGDFFIFDIEIYPPEWRKIKEIINGEEKIVRRKIPRIIENAKVKLGENKAEIIKKVNTFNKHDIMYLRYCIPKGGDNWAPETWKLLNVWNEEDRWEYNYKYQNTLFDDEFIPRYKNKITKTTKAPSKKDLRIKNLENENANLKLQIQELQQQLQNIKRD